MNKSEAPEKTSIDEDIDIEIAWNFFFFLFFVAILKCPCLS